MASVWFGRCPGDNRRRLFHYAPVGLAASRCASCSGGAGSRGFAPAQEEDAGADHNDGDGDDEVGRGAFGFAHGEGEARDVLLLAGDGHQAYEFAGLVEVVFEVDGAVGVDLGRNMQEGDGVQVFFLAVGCAPVSRMMRTSVGRGRNASSM